MANDGQLDFTLPLMSNITWQYDTATNLVGLVESKTTWYTSQWQGFWESWYTSVFNLKTANRFGCVVWAIILDVPIELIYQEQVTSPPWGFGGGRENFRYANFNGAASLPALTIEEARALLRVRYYAQTMSTTVSNINGMLKDVFEQWGLAYVEETVGGVSVPPFGFGPYRQNFSAPSNFNVNPLFASVKPMAVKYIFTFPLTPSFRSALQQYLPKGSGVQLIISAP